MADQIKRTDTLKIELLFVDEDTRTLTIKNPRSDISVQDIEAFQSFLRTSGALLGDKNAATFGRINEVKTVQKTYRYLDIG